MSEKHLTLLIGPAKYPEDDQRMVSIFLAEPGRKIICGASTAKMVSRFLSESQMSKSNLILVTDGTVILSQVLDILLNLRQLEALSSDQSDANILTSALLEADSISFLIGMAVNKSQRSLSLPAKPIIKSRLARELVEILKEKEKTIMVEYF